MHLVLFSLLAASAVSPSPPVYDEGIAVQLMHFAAATYGEKPEECVERATLEEEDWVLHSNEAMECDVFEERCGVLIAHSIKKKETVIAFRGTQGVKQLFNEGMQAVLPKMPLLEMGNFNRYFLGAHWDTWRFVKTYLSDKRYSNHSVSITGHSLGGALASIAALRIVHTGYRPSGSVRLYTFGEPRVGDAHFARLLDELVPDSFRVVHSLDIVPHVPVCRRDWNGNCNDNGFHHHGTEIWYRESMDIGMEKYRICDGLPVSEDSSCSNSIHFGMSSKYFTDHTRYFGVMVSEFGKNGCMEDLTGKDEDVSLIREFLASLKKYIPFL